MLIPTGRAKRECPRFPACRSRLEPAIWAERTQILAAHGESLTCGAYGGGEMQANWTFGRRIELRHAVCLYRGGGMHENWRLPDAYSYVVGPSAFAWEFLRRNPGYRADFQSITNERDAALISERWGYAIDPNLHSDCLASDLATLRK
jgi:hypothetical protein